MYIPFPLKTKCGLKTGIFGSLDIWVNKVHLSLESRKNEVEELYTDPKPTNYQLVWTVLTASRLLDTLKLNFCFMHWKFSQPTLGTYHRQPVWSSSTSFFLAWSAYNFLSHNTLGFWGWEFSPWHSHYDVRASCNH